MKKVLVMIAAIGVAVTCTGCGKGSLDKATLVGYDEPFEEMMEEAFDACEEEQDYEIEFDASWEDGWDESDELDEDDLDRNEEAVTYVVEQYDGATLIMNFFMVHDTKENELRVMGAKMESDDYSSEVGKSEAKDFLREVLEYIE